MNFVLWCQTCGERVEVDWKAMWHFGPLQWMVICHSCAERPDIDRWINHLTRLEEQQRAMARAR